MSTSYRVNKPTYQQTIKSTNQLSNKPSSQQTIISINHDINKPSCQQITLSTTLHINNPSYQQPTLFIKASYLLETKCQFTLFPAFLLLIYITISTSDVLARLYLASYKAHCLCTSCRRGMGIISIPHHH